MNKLIIEVERHKEDGVKAYVKWEMDSKKFKVGNLIFPFRSMWFEFLKAIHRGALGISNLEVVVSWRVDK